MKFIQQLFSQNYIKFQTHEVIFYSSFTLIIAGLAVAFFFGYVTWETSDSIVQNTDLLTPPEVQTVYVKRAVFVVSFIFIISAFVYAYSNSFDPVSTSEAVSSIPPSAVQSIIQPVVTTDITNLFADKLGLPSQLVCKNLAAANVVKGDPDQLAKFFYVFYGNVHLGGVDFSKFNPNMRAYFVHALIRLYEDPDGYIDIIKAGVEIHKEYLAGGPKPSSIQPYILYLIGRILGYN